MILKPSRSTNTTIKIGIKGFFDGIEIELLTSLKFRCSNYKCYELILQSLRLFYCYLALISSIREMQVASRNRRRVYGFVERLARLSADIAAEHELHHSIGDCLPGVSGNAINQACRIEMCAFDLV